MSFVCGLVVGAFLALLIVFLVVDHRSRRQEDEWDALADEVRKRQNTLAIISGFCGDVDVNSKDPIFKDSVSSLHIAATDMFVEKAHSALRTRKNWMYVLSGLSIILFTTLIFIFSFEMNAIEYIINNVFQTDKEAIEASFILIRKLGAWQVVYLTIRNGTLLASYLFILYVLASLFRAFLHEATILESRIHSIRLGRLFLYLKFSHTKSYAGTSRAASRITSEDLERVFGWNIETTTAFKDINPEIISRSTVGQIAAAFAGATGRRD